jgi:hypothetical protein
MSKEIVYWKQRNGTFIDINFMDVQHLRNVLKMIVKNSNKHKIEWFNNLHYGNKIAYVSDILGKSDYIALDHEIVIIYDTIHKIKKQAKYSKECNFTGNCDVCNEHTNNLIIISNSEEILELCKKCYNSTYSDECDATKIDIY